MLINWQPYLLRFRQVKYIVFFFARLYNLFRPIGTSTWQSAQKYLSFTRQKGGFLSLGGSPSPSHTTSKGSFILVRKRPWLEIMQSFPYPSPGWKGGGLSWSTPGPDLWKGRGTPVLPGGAPVLAGGGLSWVTSPPSQDLWQGWGTPPPETTWDQRLGWDLGPEAGVPPRKDLGPEVGKEPGARGWGISPGNDLGPEAGVRSPERTSNQRLGYPPPPGVNRHREFGQ